MKNAIMQVAEFVVLLSHDYILRESDFLWETKPQSYPWRPNAEK